MTRAVQFRCGENRRIIWGSLFIARPAPRLQAGEEHQKHFVEATKGLEARWPIHLRVDCEMWRNPKIRILKNGRGWAAEGEPYSSGVPGCVRSRSSHPGNAAATALEAFSILFLQASATRRIRNQTLPLVAFLTNGSHWYFDVSSAPCLAHLNCSSLSWRSTSPANSDLRARRAAPKASRRRAHEDRQSPRYYPPTCLYSASTTSSRPSPAYCDLSPKGRKAAKKSARSMKGRSFWRSRKNCCQTRATLLLAIRREARMSLRTHQLAAIWLVPILHLHPAQNPYLPFSMKAMIL